MLSSDALDKLKNSHWCHFGVLRPWFIVYLPLRGDAPGYLWFFDALANLAVASGPPIRSSTAVERRLKTGRSKRVRQENVARRLQRRLNAASTKSARRQKIRLFRLSFASSGDYLLSSSIEGMLMLPELIVRAVDTGRRNTKYTVGVRDNGSPICAMFPSLAIPSDHETAVREAGNRRLKVVDIPVGGLFYAVGPDVASERSTFDPQVMHHASYFLTDEYMALTLAAIDFMRVDHIDLLMVGLPVQTMQQESTVKKVEKRLTGTHVLAGKKTVTVSKVIVMAQPSGALVRYGLQHDRLAEVTRERNLIIDPGGETLDWIVADGMVPIKRRSDSIPVGMLKILRSIAEGISRDAKSEFRDYTALDEALRGAGKIKLFQKDYSLARYLPLANKIAERAIEEMLHSVGNAGDIANIVIAGGGAFFFRKALRASFPRHEIQELSDPLMANVTGFYLAGVEIARKLARKKAGVTQ